MAPHKRVSHEAYVMYIAVVHVAGWCGDGRDDDVCAAVSVRLLLIRRGVAVRVCGCITELA